MKNQSGCRSRKNVKHKVTPTMSNNTYLMQGKDIEIDYNKTINDVELTLELRRIRLSRIKDPEVQSLRIEYFSNNKDDGSSLLFGNHDLAPNLVDDATLQTLCCYVPTFKFSKYFHKLKNITKECCTSEICLSDDGSCSNSPKIYKLVTIIPYKEESRFWMCYEIESDPRNVHPISSQYCLAVMPIDEASCLRCGKMTNSRKMRYFFRRLRRLSHALKDRSKCMISKMHHFDEVLYKCKKALDFVAKEERLSNQENIDGVLRDTVLCAEHLEVLKEFVDFDLGHDSVLQRVEMRAMRPVLNRLILKQSSLLSSMWEEYIGLTQFIYSMAAVHVQKYIRGCTCRHRLNRAKRIFAERRIAVAVVEIQCATRCMIARKILSCLRFNRNSIAIVRIQSFCRQILDRIKFKTLRLEKESKLKVLVACKLQAFWRMKLSMKMFNMMQSEEERRLHKIAQELQRNARYQAATTIQKRTRGMIHRNVVQWKRIESGLHPRIKYFSDKFLKDGDLWCFLSSINDELLLYEKRIDQILSEEEANASCYIKEVIKVREEGLQKAWNEYNNLNGDKSMSSYARTRSLSQKSTKTPSVICSHKNIKSSVNSVGIISKCTPQKFDMRRYLKRNSIASTYKKMREEISSRQIENKVPIIKDSKISQPKQSNNSIGEDNQRSSQIVTRPFHSSNIEPPSCKWIRMYSDKILLQAASNEYMTHRRAPRVYYD